MPSQQCKGTSPYTGKRCEAKTVKKYTVDKKTGKFLDTGYCQMHQPGRESRKRCVCPYCAYHRARDPKPRSKRAADPRLLV